MKNIIFNFKENDIKSVSNWYDELILFLWGWLGMKIIPYIFLLLVQLWNFDKLQTMMTINLLTYATLFTGFIVYLFMIKPEIGNKILSSFKRNHLQRTLQGYIEYLIIYMALIIVYQLLFKYFYHGNSSNNNQSSLVDISFYKVAFVVMTVFLGPVCEELTYRIGLCSLLERKNKILAILLSGIIFGLIHFDLNSLISAGQGNTESLINELWNLPPYLISGWALGFAYVKEGCFTSSWIGHFLNNLLGVIQIYA